MVDCISNSTCDGGWPPEVVKHLNNSGKLMNKEDDYPYKGINGKCRFNKASAVPINFEDIGYIDDNENALKEAIANYGPIVIVIYASDNWKLYKSGIWYEPECSLDSNHAVTVVGYGRENGHDYWLIKNSWGKDWGEKGYIKVIRNKHENYCGMTDNAFHIL